MARREAAAEKVGRAALAKEEMPLQQTAMRQLDQPNRPQLAQPARKKQRKMHPGLETYLLNILSDDKERSDTGVERGWLDLGENLQSEQFCSGADNFIG
jgi:hypothetical protein